MQVLDHQPDTRSWSNESGHYIECYGIGTKYNEAKWKINKETGHEKVQKFPGHHFAVIPELIQKPLSQGGGGHYFGLDTKDDLLRGYAANSHGVIERLKGPYSYNDGTDDYFYNFVIKLRDSKAAAALIEHGANTWVPYSVSPHIWPISGPDNDIQDWEPIGAALVIKGAYGPQAIISKMCKGTAVQCEKSLGASSADMMYKTTSKGQVYLDIRSDDDKIAEIISSLVGKAASSPHTMPEGNKDSVTTPQVTTLVEVAKPNATVNSQELITNAQITKVVTPEQFAEAEKRNQELEKQVTELRNKDKLNTLNNILIKVKDDKAKEEFVKKWSKHDNVDQLKEFLTEVYPLIRASEEEQKPAEENKEEPKKGKAASLPKEPELPKEETTAESKAASVPVNKLREIHNFFMSGGRA